MLEILHDHPVYVLLGGFAALVMLLNEKARIVTALIAFLIVVVAIAQIVGFDLRL